MHQCNEELDKALAIAPENDELRNLHKRLQSKRERINRTGFL